MYGNKHLKYLRGQEYKTEKNSAFPTILIALLP